MKFTHDAELMNRFPRNYTVIAKLEGFSHQDSLTSHISHLRNAISESHLQERVAPLCDKWQSIFTEMRAKPKYKSSLKSLYDYYFKHGRLFQIINIVDLYNYYSLKNGIPMAGYDIDSILGDIRLAQVPKGLDFYPLGNPKSPQKTKECEVAYLDSDKVICRYWNLQDCDQTKLSLATRNILFVFDLLVADKDKARQTMLMIKEDFEAFFPESRLIIAITGPGIHDEVEL